MSSQQLNRTLGLRLVIVFVIANIIGSGIYKKVSTDGSRASFIRLGPDRMGSWWYYQFVWRIDAMRK